MTTEHRWAIDSIENGVARVEEDGENMISVPVHLLPDGVTEGQVLRVNRVAGAEGGAITVTIIPDPEAAHEAMSKSKASTARTMRASKKLDAGGDVSL